MEKIYLTSSSTSNPNTLIHSVTSTYFKAHSSYLERFNLVKFLI